MQVLKLVGVGTAVHRCATGWLLAQHPVVSCCRATLAAGSTAATLELPPKGPRLAYLAYS